MKKPQILIVEDEAIEAKLIEENLIRMNYAVCAQASTGQDAIQKAKDLQPDLILMDINLQSRLDGIQAAQEIIEHHDIPIIYLTAINEKKTLERARKTAPYGIIFKPMFERELFVVIETTLQKFHLEQKLREREALLSKTLTSIGEGVVTTDEKGLISFMNPVAEKLTGWKWEEALGKEVDEVVQLSHAKTGKRMKGFYEQTSKLDDVFKIPDDIVLVLRSNKKIPIDNTCTPIKDDKGKKQGIVIVFKDISEKRRLENIKNQHINDLVFLSEASAKFVEASTEQEIFEIIGNMILKRIKNSVILINKFYQKEQLFRLAYINGLGKHTVTLANKLGQNLIGFEAKLENEEAEMELKSGKLKLVPEGVYDLGLGRIPQKTANFIEDLLNIKNVYVMGLTREDILLGDIVIFERKASEFPNKNIIETIINQASTSLRRIYAEERVKQSAKDWEDTFAAIKDSIFLLNVDGKILKYNQASNDIFNLDSNEPVLGNYCYQVVHKDNKHIEGCPFFRMKKSLKREIMDLLINGKWYQVAVDPVCDEAGSLVGAVHIVKDITDQKQTNEKLTQLVKEKEVLLKEVYHRTKNNFQMIISLMNLQSRDIKDPTILKIFNESKNRIRTMTLVHENLYKTQDVSRIDVSDFIRSLVKGLSKSFGVVERRIQINLAVEAINIDINRVIPFGLIVNELMTNAIKYAFPDNFEEEKVIQIELKRGDENQVRMRISDNGVGLPENFDPLKAESLGLKLVKSLSEQQLEGQLSVNRDKGTEFIITIKL